MNKRRLIDCQYFRHTDVAVIHEILNGKRNYIIIENPDFTYYVEPELKSHKRETEYYKKVSELKPVTCKYANVLNSVLKEIPVFDDSGNRITNANNIEWSARRKKILANHNLYSADDSIENRLIIEYYQKYKEEIDESIPIKFMFFDIETHCDFSFPMYLELEKIYKYINGFEKSFKSDLSEFNMKYFEPLMVETNIEKYRELLNFFMNEQSKGIMIADILDENKKNIWIDPRVVLAVMNSKMFEVEKDRIIRFVKAWLTQEMMHYYYDNLGFPDENKANNRIDAISFVDTIERKLYMYLLHVPSDFSNENDNSYVQDMPEVSKELSTFIELFMVVSFLKNIEKREKDTYKELLVDFEHITELYEQAEWNEEEKIKVNEFLTKARSIIENYDEKIKIDIEYRLFKTELEMLVDFFEKTRKDIQPNIIAAHNAKFDICTLKNRLDRYAALMNNSAYNFDNMINQFIYLGNENLLNIPASIKIDENVQQQNQEKTRYVFPGLTTLDTLLLYAKLIAKERDYSLNSIALDELKDHKIEYNFDITEFYVRDIRRFIKYSAVDTLLLMRLEEKLKFIELYQFIMNDCKSPWSDYIYTTAYLANLLKYEFSVDPEGPYVMRNNLTSLNPKKDENEDEVGFQGAYNTDLSGKADSYGYYENLFDLDYSAFYPSCAKTTNICPTQFYFSVNDEDKEKHNDYMFMDRISFAHKYLGMPSIKDLMKEL